MRRLTVSIAATAEWTKQKFNFILIFTWNNKFVIMKNVASFLMYQVMCKNQKKKYVSQSLESCTAILVRLS